VKVPFHEVVVVNRRASTDSFGPSIPRYHRRQSPGAPAGGVLRIPVPIGATRRRPGHGPESTAATTLVPGRIDDREER
jgi:hypothetical protein